MLELMNATSKAIIERLRDHQCHPDTYPKTRRAAVLICLTPDAEGVVNVILTLRSSKLRSHPNEVALPGGRYDNTDENLIATAFREAEEEIGLHPSQHTYITTLHPFVSLHLLIVTPIVSVMNPDVSFEAKMNPDEVSEVFSVPLSRFLSSHNYDYQDVSWHNQMWRHHLFGVPHIPETINPNEHPVTGFTAAVLLHCATLGIGTEGAEVKEYTEIDSEETRSWEDLFINSLIESGEFEKRQRRRHGNWRGRGRGRGTRVVKDLESRARTVGDAGKQRSKNETTSASETNTRRDKGNSTSRI